MVNERRLAPSALVFDTSYLARLRVELMSLDADAAQHKERVAAACQPPRDDA
jgi:hypothetical protein